MTAVGRFNRATRCLLAGICCSMPAAWATAVLPDHAIEIRITDHKPGIADFRELFVSLEFIFIHKAGAGRKQGWIEMYGKTPLIDIVPLKDGIYATLDTVLLPAIKYDAIRIEFSALKSELHSGEEPNVTWRNSTVATDIDLENNENLALVIDLYAEDQTEHDQGGYVVKLKEIRIEKQE